MAPRQSGLLIIAALADWLTSMNKKKTAMAAIALVVVVLAMTGYFAMRRKGVTDETVETSDGQSQSGTLPIGSFSSESGQSSSQADSWLDGAENIVASESDGSGGLNDSFFGFSNGNHSGLDWATFSYENGSSASLGDFSQKTGISIYPELYSLLDDGKYAVFACGTGNGIRSSGLYLNLKLMPEYEGNLYSDEVSFAKKWEPSMLKDLKRVIFPGIGFSDEQLSQRISFSDGKYRHAAVTLPDGKKSSLNYSIVDDYLLISNSEECLDKAVNLVFSSD